MKIKIIKAFTIVELIVVIMILAILSTIWFVSYSSYLSWVRDTNRITQIDSIQNLLEIYRSKNILPYPDDRVSVVSGITNIWYQWYVWANVMSLLEFSKWWKDPKDKTYFSYYLSNNRKKFQIMSFLEKQENLTFINDNIISQTYAKTVNYSKRFVSVIWNEIGILTDTSNVPIQEIASIKTAWKIDLMGANSWSIYISHLNNNTKITDYGSRIQYNLLTNSSTIYEAPKICWTWYIPVPWNAEFNQKWFCIAKYEMSLDNWWWIPNSIWNGWSWNTYVYTGWVYITPKNDYPIADITQWQAITACSDIWEWYHLVTDNEWKTVSRDIAAQDKNWSWWKVWAWYIYAWNTWDTWNTIWCSDSTWVRANWTKTWWNDKIWLSSTRVSCSEKRQLLLSNWEIIWDFAWNVSEHVNKANTTDGTLYNSWQTSIIWCSPTSGYTEWTTCSISPANNSLLNSTNWIWKIKNSAWVPVNVFVRSWRFWDAINAGIYNLDVWYDDTYKDWWLWFRCAK